MSGGSADRGIGVDEGLDQQWDCFIPEFSDFTQGGAIRDRVFERLGEEAKQGDEVVIRFHTVSIRGPPCFGGSFGKLRNNSPSSTR